MLADALTFPDIDPVLIHIGPLAIHWYGIAYIVGLVGGWAYARRLVANAALWDVQPGVPALLDDLLVWVAIGVIVGGRLGQVLLYEPSLYLSDPILIFQTWKGGMAFHGGIAGAALAVILFARRHGVPVLSYLDIASAVAPIGLFFGRLANFVNAELWGRVTDVPWAFVFPNTDGQPRHPSQLYEAGLEGLALFVLLFVMCRSGALKRPGLVAGTFGIGYCLARSVSELFREPDGIVLGPITVGMAYSLPMLAAGLGLIAYALRRRRVPA
jgi:phosphatidylglycerol:prolipoprotein diacylglycerol transferase